MREIFELDFAGPQPFEIPALVMAAIARPGAAEARARESLAASICVQLIQQRCADDPAWGARPQLIKPIYLCRPATLIAADTRTAAAPPAHRRTSGRGLSEGSRDRRGAKAAAGRGAAFGERTLQAGHR
jgi:hypothetical protein